MTGKLKDLTLKYSRKCPSKTLFINKIIELYKLNIKKHTQIYFM